MNHEVVGTATGDTFSATIDSRPRLGLRDHLVKVFAKSKEYGCQIVEIYTTDALSEEIQHIAGMTFAQVAIDPLSPDRRRWIVLRKTIGVPTHAYVPKADDPVYRVSQTPMYAPQARRTYDYEW